MKLSSLAATIGLLAIGGTLVSSAPAHASTYYQLTSGIYSIDGTPVAYETYTTGDDERVHIGTGYSDALRPEIKVLVTKDQAQDHVEVRFHDTGKLVCASDTPVTDGRGRSFFSCTPTADIPYEYTKLSSVVIKPDGSEESEPDLWVEAGTTIPSPTITLDGYDDATKTAHVSGTGVTGFRWKLYNERVDPSKPPLTNPVTATGDVRDDGTWSGDLVGVERNQYIRAVLTGFGRTSNPAQVHLEPLEKLPAPDVRFDAQPKNGVFSGTITTRSPGSSTIYDADGRIVAAPGGNKSEPSTRTVALADSGREARYTVVVDNGGLTSEPVPFVLNAGEGSSTPSAPEVSDIIANSERATVTVEGEQGALARVVDAEGTTLSVKMLGSRGTAQITFALPSGRAGADLSVTQTAGGATSAATPIVIP